jgi:hypothetical protein
LAQFLAFWDVVSDHVWVRTIRRLVLSVVRGREEKAAVSALDEIGARPNAQDEQMRLVVDAARAAIDQEFKIAERLDAKARNQIAVGGAWYALVQAAASIAIKNYLDHGGNTPLFAWVLTLAAAGAVALGFAIAYSYSVWKLRDEKEITPDGLEAMAESAKDPGANMLDLFTRHYRFVLWHRRQNNKDRAESFKRSIPWWALSLAFGVAELLLAVALLAKS